jgi:hypothetical protein
MKKVTKEIIEELYKNTVYSRNGLDLDVIFKERYQSKPFQADGYPPTSVYGDCYNLVYYLLEAMAQFKPELGFGAFYIHSDGGMQDYLITYKKNGYLFIITREVNNGNKSLFTSVDNFVEFLNKHSEIINK